ncbi:MAG: iron-sulfur cluster assembly scaffold protein, partial [Bacilli bacterium]
MDSEMKRSIILDNYQDTSNRMIPEDIDNYIKINSNNVSCIDNIDIYVKLDGDKISDIKYSGEACVIAISSTSILSKMLVGKTLDEAKII